MALTTLSFETTLTTISLLDHEISVRDKRGLGAHDRRRRREPATLRKPMLCSELSARWVPTLAASRIAARDVGETGPIGKARTHRRSTTGAGKSRPDR